MGVKTIVYGLVLVMLVSIVYAIYSMPDYTLYGSVTVNGKILTKEDSNVITLQVDGKQLTSFKMGDVAADAYVLRVPMNSERTEGYAMTGDNAKIFIDGKEVDQNPVTIGDYGNTTKLDITATTGSPPPDQTDDSNDDSSGGSGRSHDIETPPSTETIVVSESEEETPKPEPISTKKETVLVTPKAEKTRPSTQEKETEEEKVSLWQRIINLFGFGKEESVTGKAVA